MKKKAIHIGIIGLGNMGSAIAARLASLYTIYAFDKDTQKTARVTGIVLAANIQELLTYSRVVFLAVKPQDFETVLPQLKGFIADKLVVSIAAGITTDYIEQALGQVRVVRAMPNIALKIGKSFTCICKGRFAQAQDLHFAQKIFASLGETLVLNEKMMDAATAVVGSGPGFFYYLTQGMSQPERREYTKDVFIPQFCRAAQHVGFGATQAKLAVKAIVKGSLSLLKASGESAPVLCCRVTSKGGTTEAGLKFFSADRNAFIPAVCAAVKRAEELRR
ncbi:MAG: pyrroline-5-carboxylate reductase [Candidatus Omnitrophota bacterium]